RTIASSDVLPILESDPRFLIALGDALLRRGQFTAASETYQKALTFEKNLARAYLGLGRLAEFEFHREQARDRFAQAFRLDPKDPDIIFAFARHCHDPQARRTLLLNAIVLARDTQPALAEGALAKLKLELRLGGGTPNRLVSRLANYTLKLSGYFPPNSEP